MGRSAGTAPELRRLGILPRRRILLIQAGCVASVAKRHRRRL
jgi:hypothetical protein